jgi:hypothetical protein
VIEAHKRRSTLAWFLVGTIPFLALVAWHWRYGPLAAFGDWAQYLLHADALLHGRSYTDIGYIFTNRNPYIGPASQPPGLPATLVPLLALTGSARDASAYKLLMVAFALAFLACVFLYFESRSGRAIAVATVMLLGLTLETGFVTNAVQPDVGFCAFVWGILCVADRVGPWRRTHLAVVTVLGLAALAYRVAALPLVPALALYAWMHRREIGLRPLIPVVAWCACGLVAAIVVPDALALGRVVVQNPSRLLHNVSEAARVYPFAALDWFLYPFPWNSANDAYHLVVAFLAVIGAVAWVRRSSTQLLPVFTIFYLGMLFVLPVQDTRYLMPLAPLALCAAVMGTAIAARWVAQRLHRTLSADASQRVALVAAVAISVMTLVRQATLPPPTILFDAPGVRPVFAFLRGERSTTPVRAVFMNPRVLTWETGVPAMGFFLADPDTTLAEFRAKRITHVVVGDLDTDPLRAPSIERAVTTRPDAFRRVFAEGVFTVYAFDSTRAPRP